MRERGVAMLRFRRNMRRGVVRWPQIPGGFKYRDRAGRRFRNPENSLFALGAIDFDDLGNHELCDIVDARRRADIVIVARITGHDVGE